MSIKALLLISFFTLPNLAFGDGFVSLDKAKTWMSKNKDKCVFPSVRTYRGKTSNDQGALAMLGAKPNDIERLSNPRRTPALCVFDGYFGKGAAQESGCSLGYYLVDNDSYEFIKSLRGRPMKAILPGKCDSSAVRKFLTEYKFDDFHSVGSYQADSDVWVSFNDGLSGSMESDVHILVDAFGVKPDLDKAMLANLEKQKAEEAKRKEREQKQIAAEQVARQAEESKRLEARQKAIERKQKELQEQKSRDETRAKAELLRKPCLSECDAKFKTNKEKLPCLQECNQKYLGI